MNNFATRHPVLFGFFISLIFIVLVLFAIFIGELFPGNAGRERGI